MIGQEECRVYYRGHWENARNTKRKKGTEWHAGLEKKKVSQASNKPTDIAIQL